MLKTIQYLLKRYLKLYLLTDEELQETKTTCRSLCTIDSSEDIMRQSRAYNRALDSFYSNLTLGERKMSARVADLIAQKKALEDKLIKIKIALSDYFDYPEDVSAEGTVAIIDQIVQGKL